MRDFPEVLTLRLSEAQKAELKAKAAQDERTVGELVRELIDGCLAK